MNTNNLNSTEARKQRAEKLKQARNQRFAYADYIRAYNQAQEDFNKEQTVLALQQKWEENERQQQSFFVRTFSTVGDIASNIITGALKGFEGIYDLGAGIVGAVGGVFNQDFQKSVQDHIAYDFVGENIGKPLQELTKDSYLNDGWLGGTIEDISSGLGQMLPAVAVNLVPGLGQAATLATIGGISAGNATEEAFQQEGTNYYRGLAYGLTSGVVEGATEKMFGGFNATKALTGKGYLDKLTKNIGKTAATRVVRQFVEEGLEEVAYEFVNPLMENIYKDKGFFEDFLTTEHLQDMAYAGAIGGLTSFVFGETIGRVNRRARNIQENLENLDALNQKEENLWSKNDYSQNDRIQELRNKIYSNISKELTGAKPELRQRLLSQLDSYGLNNVFTEDGQVATYTPQKNNVDEDIDYSVEPVNYNIEAYSPLLRGKESLLEYVPTSKSLTAGQVEAKKLFHDFNKGKEKLRLVFTDENLGKDYQGKKLDSLYSNGIIYVNTKADASKALIKYEIAKSLENTKQFNKYAEFIFTEIANNEALKQKYGDIQALYDDTINKYTSKVVADAVRKGQQELSDQAIGRVQALAQQETIKSIVSRYTNDFLFTDPQQLQRLAVAEPALVRKLINLVHSTRRRYSTKNDMTNVMTFLDNAETLYKNVLSNAYASIDNTDTERYNKNKGDIDYGRERRNLSSYEGEEWVNGKDTTQQTRGVQEESRESEQSQNIRNKRKVLRTVFAEEKEVRNVKIKQISHDDWDNFEKTLALTIKEDIGVEVEYYDGSAIPPGYEGIDAGFDGFMDSKNNTMYLRSDETLSEAEIIQVSKHESIHHIKTINPKAYQKVEDAILRNIFIEDFAELNNVYDDAYGEVYNSNEQKIHEEIIADIVSGRTQAGFRDIDAVNNAIAEMFKTFNENAKPEDVVSGELKYAKRKQPRDLSTVKEREFKHHYWVSAYDLLTKNEFGMLDSIISNRRNLKKYPKTPSGLYMIEVGEDGILNKIVFTDGKQLNYSIKKIIEFYLKNETTLDNYRRIIYDTERRGIQSKTTNIFKCYNATDFSFNIWTEERTRSRKSSENNFRSTNRTGINAETERTSSEGDSSDISFARTIEKDSNGTPLSPAQSKFFKDSKVRDAKGNLLVVYHGTNKGGFTAFSKDKIRTGITLYSNMGDGFYFTENKSEAQKYGKNGSLYQVYLRLDNPFVFVDVDNNEALSILNAFAKRIGRKEKYNWSDYVQANERTGSILSYYIGSGKGFSEYLKSLGYDGLVYNAYNYDSKKANRNFVAFEPNQIKETTNINPTISEDIRFAINHKKYSNELTQQLDKEIKSLSDWHFSNEYAKILNWGSEAEKQNLYNKDFEKRYNIYSKYQNGIANKDNFFSNSIATFEPIKYRPKRPPDYVSFGKYGQKSSEYWYTDDSVIRGSDHWGNGVASCDWRMKGVQLKEDTVVHTSKIYGKVKFKDIKFKTKVVQIDAKEHLIGFDSIVEYRTGRHFKYLYKINNKYYISAWDTFGIAQAVKNEVGEYVAKFEDVAKNKIDRQTQNNGDVRFAVNKNSLKHSVERDVIKAFGITTNWRETGYLLQDGTRIDLSGKKDGAPAGRRSIDHREIFDIYDDAEVYGTNAMIAFMARGNIRISPEYPGINLQLEPTQDQYSQLRKLIDDFALLKGYFAVDFDNNNGDTVATLEYENNIRSSKIINDIKYYFQEGKLPYKSPLADLRFAITKGQLKKELAKATKGKVYKKQDAEKAINNILGLLDINEEYIATIPNASKEEAINKLWIHLNSTAEGYRGNAAEDVADYLTEHAIVESLYDESDVNAEAILLLDTLKSYLRKLDLTPIKSEIYNRYDKNTNIFAVWGKRKGEAGLGIDEVAQELQESGIMYFDHQNPADQFFEIVDAYNSAKDLLKKERKTLLNEFASTEQLKTIKNAIKQEVLLAYDKYGDKTKYLQMTEKYQKKIGLLIEQLKDVKIRNKVINNLFATIDRVKGLEKYKSAAIELPPEVSAFIKELGKIKTWAGNLSNNVREIMRMYSREVNGQKLYELLANSEGVFNPTAQLIEDIAHQQGDLSTTELRNLDLILKNFIHNVRNYDKIFFENRNQSETAVATQAVAETQNAVPYKNTGFLGGVSKFSRTMIAPVWRFERLSNYQQDGIMTKMFKEFQKGVDKQALFEYETSKHFEAFLKEHKHTINTWRNQEIEIAGHKMSKGQIISLYMLSLRKQAESHLFSSVDGNSGVIRLANEKASARGETVIAIREKGEDVEINRATIKEIESKLSTVDMEFIKLAQQFFDKIARDAKQETDMALFGVSNVGEENYIPIRVAEDQIYKQMGNEVSNFSDLFNVYTPSFNKDVKPNSKNKIVVENILDIVNRHTKQMGAYYGLAIPMRTFNRVYNKKLESGQTLRAEINKVDGKFEEYVGTLLTDMQGGGRQRSGVDKTSDKVIGTIRSWGARAALGMNLKVLANQFVSLSASASVGIKYKNIMKGFGMALSKKTDYDMLVKYAPMLFLRFRDGNNIDVGLLKDDISKAGQFDKFMGKLALTPIAQIDKFIVGAVWNSALEQTKSNKYPDFSDEHYKKAAELTEKAVIKSQANYIPLYRPELLRSKNSVIQLATMFMSEPLQSFSLLVSSADKMRVAKRMLETANTPESKAKASALQSQAKAEWARATGVVFVDTIILTLIAQLFSWLKDLGNEEEEEDKVASILTDFADNYIGMIPFARDIVNATQGFRNSDMYDSAISNLGQSLTNLSNVISMITSGQAYDESEVKAITHKVIVSMSQTFGIPLRNLENYTKGIIDKFSPSTAYKIDKFFYDGTTASYLSELNTALKRGDDALADTILDAFLTEEKIPVRERELRDTFKSLYAAGYNVFPKGIGNSIEVNGEEIALTKSQQTRLKGFYAQSNEVIKSMVSTSVYKNASDSAKAKAIKAIYDYYYDLTIEEFTGESVASEKDKLFFKALPIEKIMIIIKSAKELESDKDENGKTLAGSKKRKVQEYISKLSLTAAEKYMIMGYLGYKNALGQQQVKSYIQRLPLSKAEKEALFSYCGY